jgi:hypothetical protein
MRKLILGALGVSASVAVAVVAASCVGDDASSMAPNEQQDGATPGQDGAVDTDSASLDGASDGACADGLATCGGAACGTKLLDESANCGACGHACKGGACLAGVCQPQVIATGLPLPRSANVGNGLVIDDKYLYYATGGTPPQVFKVSLTLGADGGAAASAMHSGVSGNPPQFITVRSGQVYWSQPGIAAGSGNVYAMSRDGAFGSAVSIATGNDIQGIATDGTYLFYTVGGATQTTGAIRRTQLVGAATADVITNLVSPRHLAVGANKLYWDLSVVTNAFSTASATPGSSPKTISALASLSDIVVTTTNVYWATYASKELWSATIDGDNPTMLFTGPSNGAALAVDATDAYVSFQGTLGVKFVDGALVRVPRAAGGVAKTLANLPFPTGVATDAEFVYVVGGDFTNPAAGGQVWRIRK